MAKLPAPTEEIVLTHFIVSRNVERSRRFYTEVLGGETVLEGEPSIVADMSRADAKRALDALDEIVLGELGNAQKVRLGGLVQLTVRVKPATKKRAGRNPATGEEITIAAKPASVDVRARPLAKAKAALPSVQKARRRLAASNGRASR
jgi:nucleoid DNA-binding protein